MPDFRPHELVWTHELVARFWDHQASGTARDDMCFSKQHGEALVAYIDRIVPLRGTDVLDFGFGRGALLERFLARGAVCSGLEFSSESCAAATSRLAGREGLKELVCVTELPAPWQADSFDLTVLVETLEHLLPEDRASTLAEILRLLRPGGALVITVPNDEDLEERSVICPECGATFHRKQHLTAWTTRTLTDLLTSAGYGPVTAEAVTFRAPSRLNPLRERMARSRGDKPPHLVAVARKPR